MPFVNDTIYPEHGRRDRTIARSIATIRQNLRNRALINANKVAPLTFSPTPGTFAVSTTVTIATTTPGVQIFYTDDGSEPNPTTGTLYTAPVGISDTVLFKVAAYLADYNTALAVALYTKL